MVRLSRLAVALWCAGCAGDTADRVAAHAKLAAPPAELRRDAEALARGSGLQVTFNRRVGGSIDIVLVDGRSDWSALGRSVRAARGLQGNCYALPRERTVLCDASFLRDGATILLGRPAQPEQRLAFARWVLGHEIGHIATGSSGFHSAPQSEASARDLRQQRIEYDADCWMVRSFTHQMPRAEQTALESFAIDVISSHFIRTEPNLPAGVGLLFDYNRADPYHFAATGSHPDTILRAVRLLHVAAAERHDRDLAALISPFVSKLTPDPLWTDRGPCGLSP